MPVALIACATFRRLRYSSSFKSRYNANQQRREARAFKANGSQLQMPNASRWMSARWYLSTLGQFSFLLPLFKLPYAQIF